MTTNSIVVNLSTFFILFFYAAKLAVKARKNATHLGEFYGAKKGAKYGGAPNALIALHTPSARAPFTSNKKTFQLKNKLIVANNLAVRQFNRLVAGFCKIVVVRDGNNCLDGNYPVALQCFLPYHLGAVRGL